MHHVPDNSSCMDDLHDACTCMYYITGHWRSALATLRTAAVGFEHRLSHLDKSKSVIIADNLMYNFDQSYPCMLMNKNCIVRWYVWLAYVTRSLCSLLACSALAVRAVNDQMMELERVFIDPLGLPGRKYTR